MQVVYASLSRFSNVRYLATRIMRARTQKFILFHVHYQRSILIHTHVTHPNRIICSKNTLCTFVDFEQQVNVTCNFVKNSATIKRGEAKNLRQKNLLGA